MVFKFLPLLAVFIVAAYAHPSGAPQETCQIFTANHSPHLPQAGQAPYTITVSPTSVSPGATATVTIRGNGAQFKGFFIQGQDARTKQGVGKFKSQSDAQTRDCNGSGSSDAATHVNKNSKNTVVLKWTAPASYQGNVAFRAVVVKKYEEYWNNVRSNTISVA